VQRPRDEPPARRHRATRALFGDGGEPGPGMDRLVCRAERPLRATVRAGADPHEPALRRAGSERLRATRPAVVPATERSLARAPRRAEAGHRRHGRPPSADVCKGRAGDERAPGRRTGGIPGHSRGTRRREGRRRLDSLAPADLANQSGSEPPSHALRHPQQRGRADWQEYVSRDVVEKPTTPGVCSGSTGHPDVACPV
jgi:hypothetical protein